MTCTPLKLKDAALIALPHFTDTRGAFIKTYNEDAFSDNGITFETKESYYSLSRKDVIRGMHFQRPPYQHSKIVFCPVGAILDVILDLRKGSDTFGQFEAKILSAENHLAYYIPEGFAHGFKALTDGAMTYYLVSSVYEKKSDTGIHLNSFGFDWQCNNPIISDRDLSFLTFDNFNSPF